MIPQEPIQDKFHAHIQIKPNFSPTPGLTPIPRDDLLALNSYSGTSNNKVQAIHAALAQIYSDHGLSHCPHMGLHYAGSYAWTDIADRQKMPVCVIELTKTDMEHWRRIDQAVRQLLDQENLGRDEGMCEVPVRYYSYWRSDTSNNNDGRDEVQPEGPKDWTPATAAAIGDVEHVDLPTRSNQFARQAQRTRAARRAAMSMMPPAQLTLALARDTFLPPPMLSQFDDDGTRAPTRDSPRTRPLPEGRFLPAESLYNPSADAPPSPTRQRLLGQTPIPAARTQQFAAHTPRHIAVAARPRPLSAEIETVGVPSHEEAQAEQLARIRAAGSQIPDFNPEPDAAPRRSLRDLAEAAHMEHRERVARAREASPPDYQALAEAAERRHHERVRVAYMEEEEERVARAREASTPQVPRWTGVEAARYLATHWPGRHRHRLPERFVGQNDLANFRTFSDVTPTPDTAAPRTLPAMAGVVPGSESLMWPSLGPVRERDLSLGGDESDGGVGVVGTLGLYEHGPGFENGRRGSVPQFGAMYGERLDVGSALEGAGSRYVADPPVGRPHRRLGTLDVADPRRRGVVFDVDEGEEAKDEVEIDEREIDLEAERAWTRSLEVIEGIDPFLGHV